MIEIIHADITALQIDAIVNAANNSLLGGGGVDGAIHAAAGPQLLQACREIGPCPTGDVRVTPGFNLPARWIVHAVGPIWQGGNRGEADLLASCYRSALQLAAESGWRSLAFPCISTGVYGYPKKEAARIALRELSARQNDFDRLVACCYSAGDAALYRQLAGEAGGD